ncbi:Rrf2 family transcriptional regulator [Pulveribacter sp.]|uniref:Rrf2 family transcriptional regulator n=1 Tax=Pulveribacter sp. TaxID=2678893 RepID=UPI002897AE1D|nr:Rrf2 family transcriptional regulator [Pulveribacter sp.]
MRLTTRGKLAVTAITDLALHSHGQPVPLPAISARQGVSLSYLEDIFSALRRAELVTSTRGPGGGYTLTRAPRELTVAQIVTAAEAALAAPGSPRAGGSEDMTAELWASFQSRVIDYLQSITVADLLARHVATRSPAAVSPPARRSARPARQTPAPQVPNSVFALGLTPL